MSGRRELNPLSPPWQGGILPVNYARSYYLLYSTKARLNISIAFSRSLQFNT